ncbi:hypothetical protein HJ202_24425 [Vibrio parahaemolyticus]|nr:hypothetical protein [Vibrio parahaemolyticus]EIA3186950.1 hypothetical protein [Vibrio parahaemolyticus]EJG0889475.1 hypothetical protein [Vibrio parahaemolyticus]MBE3723436.1 hypothetical protein [Vibrio parahaemolyticus]MBE4241009.1 hypothetical protein [Vibrio parahaemolyticus]
MDEIEREKISCLKHLSTQHRAILAARILQEWKVTLLALTFYTLVAISRSSSKWNIELVAIPYVSFAVVVSALASIGFLYYLHQANATNRYIAESAEIAMERFIQSGYVEFELDITAESNKRLSSRVKVAWFWQSLTITSFAVFALFIVSSQAVG